MAERFDNGQQGSSPPARRPRRWDDFVPQMLANAAGTLLAAMIIYLYATAVGLIRSNWRILAPIIVVLLLAVAGAGQFVVLEVEERVDQRFRAPGIRNEIARMYLPALITMVPVTALVILALYIGARQGMSLVAFLLAVPGVAVVGALLIRLYLWWNSRGR